MVIQIFDDDVFLEDFRKFYETTAAARTKPTTTTVTQSIFDLAKIYNFDVQKLISQKGDITMTQYIQFNNDAKLPVPAGQDAQSFAEELARIYGHDIDAMEEYHEGDTLIFKAQRGVKGMTQYIQFNNDAKLPVPAGQDAQSFAEELARIYGHDIDAMEEYHEDDTLVFKAQRGVKGMTQYIQFNNDAKLPVPAGQDAQSFAEELARIYGHDIDAMESYEDDNTLVFKAQRGVKGMTQYIQFNNDAKLPVPAGQDAQSFAEELARIYGHDIDAMEEYHEGDTLVFKAQRGVKGC